MKGLREIIGYSFKYRGTAFLVIACNILYVIFNLLSFALFVPFLQILFDKEKAVEVAVQPIYEGGFINFFKYSSEYFSYVMHDMSQADPKGALLFICISVAIAFFLKNIFRYGAVWFQSQLRMAVVRDLRDALFEKSLRLPLSYYTDERKGDLMARMQSDVGEIEVAVISMLELIFREPLAIVIHLGLLIYWSPELTLFSIILLPFTALIISVIGKSLKRTAKQGQEQMGLVYSMMEETLGGIRIIKAFNAMGQVLSSFKHENLKHQKLITKAFRKRDLSSPLNETVGAIVMICIVWYGGSLILDNPNGDSLSGQQFVAFIIVFSQLLRPIQGMARSVANLNKSKASQDRINEVLNTDEKIYEVENPVSLPELQTEVAYNNVSFRYGSKNVLKNISFSIPTGKTVALVGESGSGKSTIADLLPRFYDVQEGSITFDGIDIKDAGILNLREQIGIVSQESILFNATIRENIAFGMIDATDEEIIRAAKIANAHNFISEMPEGYASNIGERGNRLSGGQRQRMSIARAVLKNPPILILDEATSALDTESEYLVQEALDNLMKDRTSLVIAHRLSTIRNADNIIVLSKGEIKESGTHDELMNLGGIYSKLSSLQGITE
ncbi:MAG: ABC transporter ATP-binding protein [Crocinitomicaceae bacterium]|nr:ABC transporter ATP-binding protein/permease [Flavobacteriales bacterium]NQZ35897.1 ABC transporter ATP-binding protein [Crocinitomicaceae bacterium]